MIFMVSAIFVFGRNRIFLFHFFSFSSKNVLFRPQMVFWCSREPWMLIAKQPIAGRLSNKTWVPATVAAEPPPELQSDLNVFMICGSDKDGYNVCFHGMLAGYWTRASIVKTVQSDLRSAISAYFPVSVCLYNTLIHPFNGLFSSTTWKSR